MKISQNDIKLIRQLKIKKYRQKHQLFIAEGYKLVRELVDLNLPIYKIFSTDDQFQKAKTYVKISNSELKKISSLSTPNTVLGIFKIPKTREIPSDGLIIALESVQDPGNLGTIIRLCEWYGVKHLVCDFSTVDCYNHKVIQSSMGSIARVFVHYLDLECFIKNTSLPTYAMTMKGSSINEMLLKEKSIIVLGNESKGISDSILKHSTSVTIPRYQKGSYPESLNVATAAAIVLNEVRRTTVK